MAFLDQVVNEGYSGLEINLAPGNIDAPSFFKQLETLRSKNNFAFIAQQVLEHVRETPTAFAKRMADRLYYLADFKPDFINSHTGKDHFSFDDNCRIIEIAENIAAKTGIPILHETHRGRFTFHLATLLPYLKKFPELKLTGDFSHWCNVSESLLEDQTGLLLQVIPHIHHLHARIGFEQGPQVNHPFAPEWKNHLDIFVKWWEMVISHQAAQQTATFTITTEFGPKPYMPALPFSGDPVANQWEINAEMKNYLQTKLTP